MEDRRDLERTLLNGVGPDERQDFAAMVQQSADVELQRLRSRDVATERVDTAESDCQPLVALTESGFGDGPQLGE